MNDTGASHEIDPRWARRSFDRASSSYDAASVVQDDVRAALLERLALTDLAPDLILDAGCGTGHAARALKKRYPGARVLALDFSMGMLRTAAHQQAWLRPFTRVCADVERLPLPDACADLIVSNCMLQWTDLDAALAELRRILKPRGLLTFTTFGPDTLRELRDAWRHVDRHSHVVQFIDMHDVGDALVRAGFAAPVLDVERYTLLYPDVRKLAADLKALGARNATLGRPRGLTTPDQFAAMERAYEAHRVGGRLPASYEVVFGQAWAPVASTRRQDAAESISLEDMKRQLRARRES